MEAAHPKYRRWSYWNNRIVNTHFICIFHKMLLAWMDHFWEDYSYCRWEFRSSGMRGGVTVWLVQTFWGHYIPSKCQDILYITDKGRHKNTTEKYYIHKETKNGNQINNKVTKNKILNIPVQKKTDSIVVCRQHKNITIPTDSISLTVKKNHVYIPDPIFHEE